MRTPQEKKELSYSKDRRNVFGENSKASRKGIPLSKARANRAERHAQDHALSETLKVSDGEQLAEIEQSVHATKPRQWRKSADKPLGDVLERRLVHKKADD
jgi:hypothetical protein